MADDDGIVVPSCDAGAELLPVGRLEVLLCCDKDICPGIEPHEVAPPLFDQVVGDDVEAFLGKTKAL